MSHDKVMLILGTVVEEEVELTLLELCQASDSEECHVVTWVQEGMLEPIGDSPSNWRFGGDSLRRACMARRLSHDLEINPPGVALALDLLDEIATLRARLERAGIR
jgi:chaperone modulatory protein CbpM